MFLIDKELCTGCEQCVSVCPADAITMQDAKAVINQSLCRQCGICADQCPVQAISESIPTYAAQAEQQKPLPQQQPGMFSQVLDVAGRLLVEGIRHLGPGGGRGKGRGRGGSGGHFGRGGFRGRR
jgi:NAD-dependent dihydropyrimidine dehydrogenase PreA subunit